MLSFCYVSYSDERSPLRKYERNMEILGILNLLNNVNMEELYLFDSEKKRYSYDFSREKEAISEIKDPIVLAKLIVICYYMAYPQEMDTVQFDQCFNLCGILEMQRFKDHEKFPEAMLFIQDAIRLDAGYSQNFTEVIVSARDNPKIQKYFKERLKSYDIQMIKNKKISENQN